jgi:hypothetical protein
MRATGPKPGSLYVVDNGNDRVQRFRQDGTYLGQWGQYGVSGAGRFLNPNGIAVTSHGTVVVSDALTARLQEFGPSGRHLRTTTHPRLRQNWALAAGSNVLYVAGRAMTASNRTVTGISKLGRVSTSKIRPQTLVANQKRTAAKVRISCTKGLTPCKGRVVIKKNGKRLGGGSYRIGPSSVKNTSVRLDDRARALLRRHRTIKVTVIAKAANAPNHKRVLRLTRR